MSWVVARKGSIVLTQPVIAQIVIKHFDKRFKETAYKIMLVMLVITSIFVGLLSASSTAVVADTDTAASGYIMYQDGHLT